MLSSKVTLIKSTVPKVYQLDAILDHLMFFCYFSLIYYFPSCKHRASDRYWSGTKSISLKNQSKSDISHYMYLEET